MARPIVAETTLEGLRAVGVGQRRSLDGWDQIVAFLSNDSKLGPEHAALFSEPVVDDYGRVEWYAPFESESQPRPLGDLAETEQESVLAAARRLKSAIEDRAEELCESSREADKRLGETLEAALFVPEDVDVIYELDGRPVLVNWGTLSDVPQPNLGRLDEIVRAPAPAFAAPAAIQYVHRYLVDHGWGLWHLLWPVFGLLLVSIFAFLLWGCALGRPFGSAFLSFCPEPAVAGEALAEERRRGVDLLSEIERLEDQLANLPTCARREPEPEAAAPEPAPSEFDQRRSDAGGATGAITVTLIWDDRSDLDLKVRCPDGSVISFRNKASCGGTLDTDANHASRALTSEPVENVYFPEGSVEPGRYVVEVDNYRYRPPGPRRVPFRVRVKIAEQVEEYSGRVGPTDGTVQVGTFTVE